MYSKDITETIYRLNRTHVRDVQINVILHVYPPTHLKMAGGIKRLFVSILVFMSSSNFMLSRAGYYFYIA